MIDVFVIIVNYNSGEVVQRAIRSLNEEYLTIKILIVDNHSSDNSVRLLSEINDDRVELLISNSNSGFSGGVNMAYKHIKYKYTLPKHMFIFNPDAVAVKNMIFNLKESLELNEDAAVISPRIIAMNGEAWYSGAIIDNNNLKVINVPPHTKNNEIIKIDVFSGCAALFKVKCMEISGEFNEMLFMYYDEADYSKRLKKNNFDIIYHSRIVIKHELSYTTRNISYIKTYYMTRNNYMYFMNNSPFNKYVTFLLLTKHIVRNMVSLTSRGKIKNVGYGLLGIFHFLINKGGKL